MNLSIKNSDVVIEKKSTGYSVKIKNIKNSRLCNIFEKDGLYKVKCRSIKFAKLLPVEYTIDDSLEVSRDYLIYIAMLNKNQLETWIDAISELRLNERLDNR